MRGFPTVAKRLFIISIMSGAVVVGISVRVHRLLKQLLVFGDRSDRTPPNVGCRHDHCECILTIDWFSSKVNDLPGLLCDVCYEGDLGGLH